jgi:hypothetical protein
MPAQVSHGVIFTSNLITGVKEVLDIYDRELQRLIPMAVLSKLQVCCRSLAETADSNIHRVYGCLLLVNIVCYQVKFTATGRSLVRR